MIINRSEILEINDEAIIVKDELAKQKGREKLEQEEFVPNFVNPFRQND